MWCGVLGPLVVRADDGRALTVAGTARRTLFAALLVRAGRTVSVDVLIGDLWGETPPRSAGKTLQSHVARLRNDLGRGHAGPLLVTDRAGYRLDLDADDVDALAFETRVQAGGDGHPPDRALTDLDTALELWRGVPYEEFTDVPFLVTERVRLAELRALAEERRTDLALGLGRSADLVPDLHRRVAAEPYRERGWEQLILALYAGGRQNDALATYRRAVDLLAGDLGVDPGPDLRALEDRILRHDPTLMRRPDTITAGAPAGRPPDAPDRCPYRGLAGYLESDADLFVGRERLVAQLAGKVAEQPVVVVAGASGTGKSSLLRAGLVPTLRAGALPGSAAWRITTTTPAGALAALAAAAPDLLVVDQGEELFTDLAGATDVVRRLAEYVEAGGRLIVALRADFYGRLVELEPLGAHAQRATVLVGPLRPDELRRVVVEPARRAGLDCDDELVDTVLDEVGGQSAALPLVSVALVRTWDNRAGTRLTLAGYRSGGGVVSALEDAAEDAFARLDEDARPGARRLLVRLAGLEGEVWVRRPLARAEVRSDPAAERALEELAAVRLLTVSADRIELTHEALLEHWPRLRDWLAERASTATLLEHVHATAQAWSAAGRPASDLYRGARLQAALDHCTDHAGDLSWLEIEFLDASEAAASAELASARAQLTREARGRRRLRAVVAVLAAVFVAAAVVAAVAVHERASADRAATAARRSELDADSQRLAALSADAPDIATSSLLAVAAYRLQDSPGSRGALLAAVERNGSALWRIATPHRLLRLVATPDGRRLAALDNQGDVLMVDPRTRAIVSTFAVGADALLGITPDGADVVVRQAGALEGSERLGVVSTETGRTVRSLGTDADPSDEGSSSPDGRLIVEPTTTAMGGGVAVDVFDATDLAAPPRRFAVPAGTVAVAASDNDVAVQLAGGDIQIRDAHTLHIVRTVHVAGPRPTSFWPMALSADGREVVTADPADPRRATVYPASGPPVELPEQQGDVGWLAFSPGGADVVVTSLSGSVTVYRAATGATVQNLPGHAGPAMEAAWTGTSGPTGLYTVGLDSELVSWSFSSTPASIARSGPDLPAPDHMTVTGHVAFGLTPSQFGAPSTHHRLVLADLRSKSWTSWPFPLPASRYVNSTVASSDGRRGLVAVQTLSGRNRVEIWDLVHRRLVGDLALPPDAPPTFPLGFLAAISPDGRTAYCSLGRSRIGVFALPSGRYERSFTVTFDGPDGARVVAWPLQTDPSGRLLVTGYDTGPHTADDATNFGPNDSSPPDQRLAVVDPSTGTTLGETSLGNVGYPSAVAWSPGGRLLAVGTLEGTLNLYDAATLAVRTRGGAVEPGFLSSVSFSPDGRDLVTGGTGGALSFWSVPQIGREGDRLPIGNGSNNGGIFGWYAPSGDVVGFASDPRHENTDEQRWFDMPAGPSRLAAAACSLAGADITHAQWRRYVGDRPYRHVCP